MNDWWPQLLNQVDDYIYIYHFCCSNSYCISLNNESLFIKPVYPGNMVQFRTCTWLIIVSMLSLVGMNFRITKSKGYVKYKFHEEDSQNLSFHYMHEVRLHLENHSKTASTITWKRPLDYRIKFRGEEYRHVSEDNLRYPGNESINSDRIQTVVKGMLYVFWAYFDGRIQNHPLVRIIAIINKPVDNVTPTWCQMWYPNKEEPEIVRLYR